MSLFKHSPQQTKSWNLIGRLIVRALDLVTGTELVVGTELVDVASAVLATVLSVSMQQFTIGFNKIRSVREFF